MKINRNEAFLIGVVALVVLLYGLLIIGPFGGNRGMLGFGMLGPGMMGGMVFYWLLLLVLATLIPLGLIIWLASRGTDHRPIKTPRCLKQNALIAAILSSPTGEPVLTVVSG